MNFGAIFGHKMYHGVPHVIITRNVALRVMYRRKKEIIFEKKNLFQGT